jgi:S-DNA-T family DNA segregation ATPase FtsK/SpoIIIE
MPLALEVPHPAAEPLLLPDGLTLPPHSMILGESYNFAGAQAEVANLDEVPHVLIAGTTGSGKSNLLSNLLYTLCLHTSPADLRLVLIDLKNEDLQPFVDLPHVEQAALSMGQAAEAVRFTLEEKDQRVRDGRYRRQRLLLVIDELAEMARIKGAMQQLASILAIGRSKRINVIAATQKPVAAVVGSTNKANFTLRLVGRVLSSDDARVAAGQSGTGAEYLPGRGSFLRVDGAEVRRFQSYYVEDMTAQVEPVKFRWHEQLSFPLAAMEKAVQL